MRQTGHVDDDTCISHKKLKSIETNINTELKKLTTWLRLNNLSLNSDKTELIFFHHSLKYFYKKLYPVDYIRYLGM